MRLAGFHENSVQRRPHSRCFEAAGHGRLALVIMFGLLFALVACNGDGHGRQDECFVNVDCQSGEDCVDGVCVPREEPTEGCTRDAECAPGERCDVLAGECVPRGHQDPGTICFPGDTRCVDENTRATCSEDGMEWEEETCELACVDGECTICVPGEAECVGDVSRVCSSRGTAWEEVDCSELGVSCDADKGVCLLCVPGDRRCADQYRFEICNDHGSGWDDYACKYGLCDEETAECVGCTPGIQYTCEGTKRMVCGEDGETWELVEDCADSDASCENGRCVDLCDEAVMTNSYIGCEYWPVVLANSVSSTFHNDFAVVVSNPNEGTSADVRVYDVGGSVVQSETVSGGELKVIYLPWNAMPATSNNAPTTQKGAIAYRMESSVPVTAYQFNPLRSKIGGDYSHTNDASLLLPTHVFGTESQYVAMALPHMHLHVDQEECIFGECIMYRDFIDADQPTILAVVGTEDNTQVRLRLRGATAAGGGLAAQSPGAETTVILNKHEVLQLASRPHGASTEEYRETVHEPDFMTKITRFQTFTEYRESDLTGSIIDSDKPVAVYAGAECRFVPFNEWACDHLEQQLFPFQNWGSAFVGTIAEPPPEGDPSVGDLWRIVAAVDGTQVTFQPAVHGSVTLGAGDWIEFQTHQHFHVSSQGPDHPIMLSQFFVGQNAHGGSMGDPTMILSVPTEQYRKDYAFITTETIARNYINAVRPTGATVNLDGQELPAGCWTSIPGTGFEVCRHELDGGTYSVTASEPIGLTVYGLDSYVSYGYPAGLDLRSIVSANPGW